MWKHKESNGLCTWWEVQTQSNLKVWSSGNPHGRYQEDVQRNEMDRWNKAGLRESTDIKLKRKSTESRRVEGCVGGVKNSWRVVMPMKRRSVVRMLMVYKL